MLSAYLVSGTDLLEAPVLREVFHTTTRGILEQVKDYKINYPINTPAMTGSVSFAPYCPRSCTLLTEQRIIGLMKEIELAMHRILRPIPDPCLSLRHCRPSPYVVDRC